MADMLEELAKEIRNVYVFERRRYVERTRGVRDDFGQRPIARWDGGTDAGGRRHEAVWPKLARHFLEHSLDPASAVCALFGAVKAGPPPTPDKLTQPWLLAASVRWKNDKKEELGLLWEFDKQAFQRKILMYARENPDYSATKRWMMAGVSADTGASPLGRYVYLKSLGEERAAALFFPEALTQFRRFPDLFAEVYGNHLPEELKHAHASMKKDATEKSRCNPSKRDRFRR